MNCRRFMLGPLAVLSFGFISTFAQAPTVGVSNFENVNAPGAIETDTFAVNSSGVIAGDYVDHNNTQHGMILNNTSLTSVDRPGCQTTPGPGSIAFFGIDNAQGKSLAVAGWCFNTVKKTNVAFLYSNGGFVPIRPPGAKSTIAQGINDKREVVGAFVDNNNVQHGFLFTGTQYLTLNVPKHSVPNAWSINDNGLISIFALNTNGHYDSFLFNGKTYTNVNFDNVPDSIIQTIDKSGDRIYTVYDSSGNSHGAFFLAGTGGGFAEFDFPGARETQASGLSGNLKIVGNYQTTLTRPGASASQGYSALGCCRGLPAKK